MRLSSFQFPLPRKLRGFYNTQEVRGYCKITLHSCFFFAKLSCSWLLRVHSVPSRLRPLRGLAFAPCGAWVWCSRLIYPGICVKKINSNKLNVGPLCAFSWDHVVSIGYKVPRKLVQRTNAWLIRVDFFYTYSWVNGLCFGYFQFFLRALRSIKITLTPPSWKELCNRLTLSHGLTKIRTEDQRVA